MKIGEGRVRDLGDSPFPAVGFRLPEIAQIPPILLLRRPRRPKAKTWKGAVLTSAGLKGVSRNGYLALLSSYTLALIILKTL